MLVEHFEQIPPVSPESLEKVIPPEHEELFNLESAKKIANTGDYETIKQELCRSGWLEIHKQSLHEKHNDFFTSRGLELTQQHWEMLTILHLYDEGTFEHSIRTFGVAHEITTTNLPGPSSIDIRLDVLIQNEGVSHENFLLAALFHDMGKITIRNEILNDPTTKEEQAQIFIRMIRSGKYIALKEKIGLERSTEKSDEDILSALRQANLTPFHIVPVKEIYTPEKLQELFGSNWEEQSQRTLYNFIQSHESASRQILEKEGLNIPSVIAGQHHNYDNKPFNQYTLSTETLQICATPDNCPLSQLLALADISDALKSNRSYKKELGEENILATLIQDAQRGHLNTAIVYLWVNHKYAQLPQVEHSGMEDSTQQRDRDVIEKFLQSSRETISQYQK